MPSSSLVEVVVEVGVVVEVESYCLEELPKTLFLVRWVAGWVSNSDELGSI